MTREHSGAGRVMRLGNCREWKGPIDKRCGLGAGTGKEGQSPLWLAFTGAFPSPLAGGGEEGAVSRHPAVSRESSRTGTMDSGQACRWASPPYREEVEGIQTLKPSPP